MRFADIDHAGIVYYPVFYDYFHQAFEAFFHERLGPRGYANLLDVDRLGFPAVQTRCEYTAPLRFGDIAEVEVSLVRLGGKSLTLGYAVFRASDSGGARAPVARGEVTTAVVDLDAFSAVELPEGLRTLFGALVAD